MPNTKTLNARQYTELMTKDYGTSEQVSSMFSRIQELRPKKVKRMYRESKAITTRSVKIVERVIVNYSYYASEPTKIRSIYIEEYNDKSKKYLLVSKMMVNTASKNKCVVETFKHGYKTEDVIFHMFEGVNLKNMKIYQFGNVKIVEFYYDDILKGLCIYDGGFMTSMYTFNKDNCNQHLTLVQNDKGSLSLGGHATIAGIMLVLGTLWFIFNILVASTVFLLSIGALSFSYQVRPDLHPFWRGVYIAIYGIIMLFVGLAH